MNNPEESEQFRYEKMEEHRMSDTNMNHVVTFGIAAVDQLIHRAPLGGPMFPHPLLASSYLDLPFKNSSYHETSQSEHHSMKHTDISVMQNDLATQLKEENSLSAESDEYNVLQDNGSDSSDSDKLEGWGDAMVISTLAELVCLLCGRPFPNLQERDRHQKFAHVNDHHETCKFCGVFFRDKTNFIQHIEYHLRENNPGEVETEFTRKWFSVEIMFCGYCDTAYIDEIAYEKHLIEHDIEQRPSVLKQSLVQPSAVVHHILNKVTCNFCESVFMDKKSITQHIKLKHLNHVQMPVIKLKTDNNEPPEFKCNICFKIYRHRQSLTQHSRRVHNVLPSEYMSYPCSHCEYTLIGLNEFKNHMKMQHKEHAFFCDICHRLYKLRKSLHAHKQNDHNPNTTYHCIYCEDKFHDTNTLESHMKVKHGGTFFTCEFCPDKYLKDFKCFNNHRRKAHGAQPIVRHRCNSCPFVTFAKTELVNHVKSKHKIQCHSCKFCGKVFQKKIYIYRHLQLHRVNDKTYSCDKCDKSFKLQRYLNQHKKYSCV